MFSISLKSKPFWWKFSIFGAIIFLVGGLIVILLFIEKDQQRLGLDEQAKGPRFDRFRLSGVSYTSYFDGNKKRFSFSADEVVHGMRKIGPLTINPIKEIQMTHVRIEIHQEATEKENRSSGQKADDDSAIFQLPFHKIIKETVFAQGLGAISRVVIRKAELVVLRGLENQFTILVNKVKMDPESSVVRFEEGFSVSSHNGDQLVAKEAELKNNGKRIWIKGPYLFRDPGGSERGSRGSFYITSSGRIKKEAKP